MVFQWQDFTLQANAWGMGSNYCLTTWFDWAVSSGHFDARAVRLCYRSDSQKAVTSTETASATYVGMQKFAACYGATNTMNGCSNYSSAPCPVGTQDPNFSVGYNNTVTRYWVRDANGTNRYHDGGDPRSA